MKTTSKYYAQGERAFATKSGRDSHGYKDPVKIREWNRGYDDAAEHQRQHEARVAEDDKRLRWVDSTSYSQGERGKREPDCWDLESTLLRGYPLTVFNLGKRGRDVWVVRLIGSLDREYPAMPAEEIKHIAIGHLREHLEKTRDRAIAALEAVTEFQRR